MMIGCCTSFDMAETLKEFHYDAITLAATDVVTWNREKTLQVRDQLREYGLKCNSMNSFCSGSLRLTGDGFSREAVRDYAKELAERAELLGIPYVGIGAPEARNLSRPEEKERAWEQFHQAMEEVCHVFSEYGMEALLESLCARACNFITTTEEALKFVKEAGIKNLHLVYDIYHEGVMNQSLDVIRKAAKEIKVVHIAQDSSSARYYLSEEHLEEYRKYWKVLEEIGFRGEFTIEAFEGDIRRGMEESMRVIHLLRE